MYANSTNNSAQEPAGMRNQLNRPVAIGNNLVPGPNAAHLANLTVINIENLTRAIVREYNRLNVAQKRMFQKLLVAPASFLVAVLGAINIYANQKNQSDTATANVNSGLWSIAFLPLAAFIGKSVKEILSNSGEVANRVDDETASLSLQSESDLNALEEGLEMGSVGGIAYLSELAAVPEPTPNPLRNSSDSFVSKKEQEASKKRFAVRSRSFP